MEKEREEVRGVWKRKEKRAVSCKMLENVKKTDKEKEAWKAGGQADQRGSWEILDQNTYDQRRASWEASCC